MAAGSCREKLYVESVVVSIANEQFLSEGYMTPKLGYNEFYDTQKEGTQPTVLIFGTN